jgi:hypothetical protein
LIGLPVYFFVGAFHTSSNFPGNRGIEKVRRNSFRSKQDRDNTDLVRLPHSAKLLSLFEEARLPPIRA